jgi:hypothetical protein
LNTADVILLLVSADYLASNFTWGVEMKRALERHKAGETWVIPIIVRPLDWKAAPFRELQVLPSDAKPISTWANRDEAYLDIEQGIRKAIEGLRSKREQKPRPHEKDAPKIPRQGIRTGADKDVTKVKQDVVMTTIKELAAQPRPEDMPLKAPRASKYQSRRADPVETTRWSIEAMIIAYKLQQSGGYSLILQGTEGETMIAVAPDPKFVSRSSLFVEAITSVRRTLTDKFAFRAAFTKTQVLARVVGVGFFNSLHGQTGVAPNAVELHPILSIEWLRDESAPSSQRTDQRTRKGINLQADFYGVRGSDGGINVRNLPKVFAEINPGLELTIKNASREIRGNLRLRVHIEGLSAPSDDFVAIAREALQRSINEMRRGVRAPSAMVSFTINEVKELSKDRMARPTSRIAFKAKKGRSKPKRSARKTLKKR